MLSVDPKERRISITPPGEGDAPSELAEETTLTGRVQRLERYGVFVWLGPGRVGLMPKMLTGTPPGTDLDRRFKVGDSVEVTIVEITDGGRKIRLAAKGVEAQKAERRRPSPRREPEPQPEQPTGTFGTSLADKLRAALGERESE